MHGPNPGLNYVQCLHRALRTEAIPRRGISVPPSTSAPAPGPSTLTCLGPVLG